jgi:hypothetical protein
VRPVFGLSLSIREKKASHRLGNDQELLTLKLGNDGAVSTKINRSANPNGSVRLVGNNGKIATWFQEHFGFGDLVIVLSPNHIKLLLPPPK